MNHLIGGPANATTIRYLQNRVTIFEEPFNKARKIIHRLKDRLYNNLLEDVYASLFRQDGYVFVSLILSHNLLIMDFG